MTLNQANTLIYISGKPIRAQDLFWETTTGGRPFNTTITVHRDNLGALDQIGVPAGLNTSWAPSINTDPIKWIRISHKRATNAGPIDSQISIPAIIMKPSPVGEFYYQAQCVDPRYLWQFALFSAQVNMMRKVNNIIRPPIGAEDGIYERQAGIGASDNYLANQVAQFNEQRFLEVTLNPFTNEPWTALELLFVLLRNWIRAYASQLGDDQYDPDWWKEAFLLPFRYYDVNASSSGTPDYNQSIETQPYNPTLILDSPASELENKFPILNKVWQQKSLDLIVDELCDYGRLEVYLDVMGNIHIRKADDPNPKPWFSLPPNIVANSSRITGNRITPRSQATNRPSHIVSTCRNKFECFFYYTSAWDDITSTTPVTPNQYGLSRKLENVVLCPHDETWTVNGEEVIVRAGEYQPMKDALNNWGLDNLGALLANLIPTGSNLGQADAVVRHTFLNNLLEKVVRMYFYEVSAGNQESSFFQNARGVQLDPAKAAKRCQAIRRHYRQTWRISEDDMRSIRRVEAKMATKLDPKLGNLQPSEVYMDYCRIFSGRVTLDEIAELEQFDGTVSQNGGNFSFDINLPAPFNVSMVDPYLGIFRINPLTDEFTGQGATLKMIPSQVENLVGLNPSLAGRTTGEGAYTSYLKPAFRIGVPLTIEFFNDMQHKQNLYFTSVTVPVEAYEEDYSGESFLPPKTIYTDLTEARYAFKRTGRDESIVSIYPMADVDQEATVPVNDYEVKQVLEKAANLAYATVRDDLAGSETYEGLYPLAWMSPYIRSIKYMVRKNGGCSMTFNARDQRVIPQLARDLGPIVRQLVYRIPRDYGGSRWEN